MIEASSKPKRGMSHIRKTWQGYMALLVALVVCFGFLFCFHKTASFPSGANVDLPIIYPLILLTRNVTLRTVFWGITAATLIGLLLIAHNRRVSCLFTGLMCLLSMAALFYAAVIMAVAADLMPRQTILLDGRGYHLLLQSQTGTIPFKAYVVIKCDKLDLVCQYVATPFAIIARKQGYEALKNFDESGALFIDETDQALKLRVGAEVYRVDDWSDRPW